MINSLTDTEETIRELLPEKPDEIADMMGYMGNSTVYDHIASMRNKGLDITQDERGCYVELIPDGGVSTVTNHSEPRRKTTAAKQTITKKANQYLTELEEEIKEYQNQVGPAIEIGGPTFEPGNNDVVIHCTDDHFGDFEKDINGNVTFDKEIAAERVRKVFETVFEKIALRESMGMTVDTVHLLLGGDHVTNEAIYDKQPWETEMNIKEQIKYVTSVYFDQLERLSDRFDSVQVVCMAGNHGEFRVDGSSNQANADSFFYDRLELATNVHPEMNNVTFVKSDRKDHINFEMRGGIHKGHLRHGQNEMKHIGTSSPKSDWRSYVIEYNFDIAYRGHYHTHKIERINGRPVIEGGSIRPSSEYSEAMGEYGNPMSYIHGVSDDSVLEWSDYIYH